jgi:hypothetical protein
MSVARTARFALVVAFLAACATAALADYFDPVQTYSSLSSSVGFSTDRYLGQGTAVADGRVIFPPAAASASRVGIYDPNGNSGTGSFTLTLTVENAYYSYYTSALMLDGRVCFVPYFKDQVAVFDPATDSLEYFDTNSTTDRKYNGGVAANDGRIIMAPYDEDGVGVFDPTVDQPTFTKFTFTTHPSATGNNAYEGAAKAGNGKIVFAPYRQSTPVGIFDPETNTFSTVPHGAQSSSPSGSVFSGAAAAYGGKVVLAPIGPGDSIAVYDPDTEQVTTTPHGQGMDSAFHGAASRVYDGKVILAPRDGDKIGVFDVRDNSLTLHSPTGLPTGTNMFWSPTNASATRILMVGRSNAGQKLGVFDIETCDPIPNTMLQSIGRCGVPPCESCCVAMREMGLFTPIDCA